MKLIALVNYILKPILNRYHTYINYSLSYVERRRTIDTQYMDYIRLSTLELVAGEIAEKKLAGNVAELGVYKGKFARYINQYFPERKLYLFDTFKGFDESDIAAEIKNTYSAGSQDFTNTSVSQVLKIMPFPDQCIVKEGYFPQTASGLEDDFVFVSLDADLYDPIYAGLNYFYPRLVKGGYIFIHDYNNDCYKGAKQAVRQFCAENNLSFLPIPDTAGTAIIGK